MIGLLCSVLRAFVASVGEPGAGQASRLDRQVFVDVLPRWRGYRLALGCLAVVRATYCLSEFRSDLAFLFFRVIRFAGLDSCDSRFRVRSLVRRLYLSVCY